MLENTIVFALVALCAAYSLWALLPAALKRSAATVLLNSGIPLKFFSEHLLKLTSPAIGCGSGCGSCSSASSSPESMVKPAVRPVVWHYKK